MGAWVTYGLGSECQNLPGFRRPRQRPDPARRPGHVQQRLSPADYQGSIFKRSDVPVADLARSEPTAAIQNRKLDLMRKLDHGILGRMSDDKIESAICEL